MEDIQGMRLALEEARKAAEIGEVPIGAVIVRSGASDGEPGASESVASGADEIVGRGHNRRETDGDPLAHAEIQALHEASRRQRDGWRLLGTTMYVTLEPCAMCAGALVLSRVERLVYGAADPKAGFCGSLGDLVRDPRLNHRLEVTAGVLEEECSVLLKGFFARLRDRGSGRKGPSS